MKSLSWEGDVAELRTFYTKLHKLSLLLIYASFMKSVFLLFVAFVVFIFQQGEYQ